MRKAALVIVVLTAVFLLAVVVYGALKSLFLSSRGPSVYSGQEVALGILAETIRAALTHWLYLRHDADKTSLAHALRFGTVCSLLIGSLWIVLGSQFIDATARSSFIIDDSLILLFQGFLSGVVLWMFYKDGRAKSYNS